MSARSSHVAPRIRASDTDHQQSILQAAADGDLAQLRIWCGDDMGDISDREIRDDSVHIGGNNNNETRGVGSRPLEQRRRQRECRQRVRSARCKQGCTALHWAAGYNRVAVLDYLLSYETNTDGDDGTEARPQQQHHSRRQSHPPNKTNHNGTPIPLPPVFQNDVDIPCTGPSRGRTPLHYAARNGCLAAVQRLMLVHGANPHASARHGVTPFQLALFQNQYDVVTWLVDVWSVSVAVVSAGQPQQAQPISVPSPTTQEHDGNNNNNNNTADKVPIAENTTTTTFGPIDPALTNDFGCGPGHWLALCPDRTANLLPLAKWLTKCVHSCCWTTPQQQGHTAFHKAAWAGHVSLLQYLHTTHNVWDDQIDHAGNRGVDLARMAAGHDGHGHKNSNTYYDNVVKYLTTVASPCRRDSAAVLGLAPEDAVWQHTTTSNAAATEEQTVVKNRVHQAYRREAQRWHPDRPGGCVDRFQSVCEAYRHLCAGGHGRRTNPAHDMPLLLTSAEAVPKEASNESGSTEDTEALSGPNSSSSTIDDAAFLQMRLLTVVKEYGPKGLDVANVKRKWRQVWPQIPFPDHGRTKLGVWLQEVGRDILELRTDAYGTCRAHAKC